MRVCANCGTKLTGASPAGLCPACFLQEGLTPVEAEPSSPLPPPPQRFADYELIGEIARGGMGVVYKARQVSLNRIVAVKMMLGGSLAGAGFVQRFRTEAEAVASLQHPNIVAIHEVGEHGGQPFFSMDYVEGRNLAELTRDRPLPARQAATYLRTIATAVHYAHQHGILHRDLKPSNILIDSSDEPRITDFGLAKRLPSSSDLEPRTSDITLSGQVLGSPNYLPPEQAEGRRGEVGPPSDVYGLGAVLYHLLTGRPPFQGETVTTLLKQVLDTEPVSPRLLNPSVPRDLETICLKCLEKEKARRYATAQALAEELDRFLKGEPILARPIGPVGKTWRWCSRKPALAGALAACLGILALGVAGITWQWRRALAGESSAQRSLYVANMNMAQQAWEQNNVGRVRQLLEEAAAYPERGFEWYYWQRQTHLEIRTFHEHGASIGCVAFSPDGRRIATSGDDPAAKVWDAVNGRELLTLKGHQGNLRSVAFSPDGRRIVTGSYDLTAKVWDAVSGENLLTLKGHSNGCGAVFSPDGQRILTGGDDRTAKVWDAASGAEFFTFKGHSNWIWAMAWSPDSQRIVTGGADKIAKVWEAASGKELATLAGHTGGISAAAFSPDGRQILTGSVDQTAKLWDGATGQEILTLKGHADQIRSVAFSPEGRRIITASWDETTRIWTAANGEEILVLKGHTGGVNSVAISPDGRWIVTGSRDQTAKIWDAAGAPEPLTLEGHSAGLSCVAFSPSGLRIVTAGEDQTAKVWESASGQELVTLKGHSGTITSVAFSPDGHRLATASGDTTVRMWEMASGREIHAFKGHSGWVRSVAFSPDGQRLATGSWDEGGRVWDAVGGKELLALKGHTGWIWSAAYSPDGGRLVTGSGDRTAKVWVATTGKELLTLKGHNAPIRSVAFSPDGRRIATGSDDRTAKVWEAASGRELFTLVGHGDLIRSVAFSPDGQRLVTGSDDLTAKVWETAGGKETLTLRGHSASIWSVAFSPDGQRIVTGSRDGTAKVWNVATAQEVAAWQQEEQVAAQRLAALRRAQTVAAERARAARTRDPGAIKRWLVLAPIPMEDRNGVAALDHEQIRGEADLRPRPGDVVTVGWRQRVWSAVQLEDHLLNFNQFLGGLPNDWSVAYSVCYIQSEATQGGYLMKVGSDDHAKIYLNGKEIYRYVGIRGCTPDQDVVPGVQLNKGLNVLVFKVVNETVGWQGAVRFTDAAGQPVKGIKVTLDPN